MAERDQPVPEADTASESLTEGKPKGKGRFRLILIPLILLAAAGGAWVAYSQYGTLAGTAAALGLGGDANDAEKPIEYGEFMEIDGLVINPANSEGRRYLMVKLGLESNKGAVLEELKQKEVVVRATVLKLLAAHTVEDLANIELRAQIKEELRSAVNAILRKGEVDRLYFTQYVLQ